jgi:hypothetical protein
MLIRWIKALKGSLVGFLLLFVALICFLSLIASTDLATLQRIKTELSQCSDYNYVPAVKKLHEEGKLDEAISLAQYIQKVPGMPGKQDAAQLEAELVKEKRSWLGKADRTMHGFVVGEGHSIEEMGGAIASDMIIYGDIRDLVKQGYYRVTGKETDRVVAALAGIGLATELVDAVDWGPAVLKLFRKMGSLSRGFCDWLVVVAKKSTKARKLDGTLKVCFLDLKKMVDGMGLARTAAIFKYVDAPADLRAVTRLAEKSRDTGYLLVKFNGKDGVKAIKRLGDSDGAVELLKLSVRKGPEGVKALNRTARRSWFRLANARFASRLMKNLRLGRIQELLRAAAVNSTVVRWGLWLAVLVCTLLGGRKLVTAYRLLRPPKPVNQETTCT